MAQLSWCGGSAPVTRCSRLPGRHTPRGLLLPTRATKRVLHGEHGHGNHSTPWYEKNKDLWLELSSTEELSAAAAASAPGQLLVVDYYASWCAVCKTAFPGLCRLAADTALQSSFKFAKASLDHPEVKEWVKNEAVTGIPHLAVYGPGGAKLLGMGASFKKLEAIRANLQDIAAHAEVLSSNATSLPLDEAARVILPEGLAPAEAAAAVRQ